MTGGTASRIAELSAQAGHPLRTSDDQVVGIVVDIYLDEDTRRPKWARVSTARRFAFQFVPLDGASAGDDGLRVPYLAETILNGPYFGAGEGLSSADEERLRKHYGLEPEQEDSLNPATGLVHLMTNLARTLEDEPQGADAPAVAASPPSPQERVLVERLASVRRRLEAGRGHLQRSERALQAAMALRNYPNADKPTSRK
jgi:PRC-barrel domain